MSDPTNRDDTIDSHDVIARIDELHDDLRDAFDELISVDAIDDSTDFDAWVEKASEDSDHENFWDAQEYLQLRKLADQAEGYGDWAHGATLIRDSYFQQYAEELAGDIGAFDSNAGWPLNCIDWEQAARELQVDYTTVDFDGVDYLMRS